MPKPDIHPTWYPDAKVICNGEVVMTTGVGFRWMVVAALRVAVASKLDALDVSCVLCQRALGVRGKM
jgi:hypothetical protein